MEIYTYLKNESKIKSLDLMNDKKTYIHTPIKTYWI